MNLLMVMVLMYLFLIPEAQEPLEGSRLFMQCKVYGNGAKIASDITVLTFNTALSENVIKDLIATGGYIENLNTEGENFNGIRT